MSVIPPDNPLSYVGKEPVKRDYLFRRNPTAADFAAYEVGDSWINFDAGNFFVLVSKAGGSSTWAIGGGSGSAGVATINTIAPDGAGDFTIASGAGITITPGVNQITIASTASTTLQGDVGGMQTSAAGNFRLLGTNVTGSGISIDSSGGSPIVEWRMSSPFSISDFSFEAPSSGSLYTLTTQAFFNVAGSAARNFIQVGGGAAGDPYIEYAVGGANNFATGLDNSDGDAYKITTNTGPTSPSTGTTLSRMDATGARTLPLQPSFRSFLAANSAGVTGGGAVFQIPFAAEQFDQGSDFNTGTSEFTAPIAGNYFFTTFVSIGNLTAAMNTGILFITNTVSGINYNIVRNNIGAFRDGSNIAGINGTFMLRLAASDIIRLSILVSGGVGNTADVNGDPNGANSWFSGWLVN